MSYGCAWEIQSNLNVSLIYTEISTPMFNFTPLLAFYGKKDKEPTNGANRK